MRISDWSSDVCSSDLTFHRGASIYHDLTAKAYEAGYLVNERGDDWWRINIPLTPAMFSPGAAARGGHRSEEHTSELQSLMRISYAVFCLKKKKDSTFRTTIHEHRHKTVTYKS